MFILHFYEKGLPILFQVSLLTCPTMSSISVASTNNLLDVMLVSASSPTNTQLQCTFLSGFIGSALCAVQYGTDPSYMNLAYFSESSETGTAGESVTVVLGEPLISSTTHYYNATVVAADTTVVVQGSFTTPQYSKYLCRLPQLCYTLCFNVRLCGMTTKY